MINLEELKRLAEAARSSNCQSGYDGIARACTAATILSLIQRVEEAEAKLLQAGKDEAELLSLSYLQGVRAGRAASRAEALEEAAKALAIRPSEIRLIGGELSAQEMRSVLAMLENRAQAIRALKEKAPESAAALGIGTYCDSEEIA